MTAREMKRLEERIEHERWTLAPLLKWPEEYAWWLASMEPAWFCGEPFRQIAGILCDLRDRGRRIHWRRVRWMARVRHGESTARWVTALCTSIGCAGNMDYWCGELQRMAQAREVA